MFKLRNQAIALVDEAAIDGLDMQRAEVRVLEQHQAGQRGRKSLAQDARFCALKDRQDELSHELAEAISERDAALGALETLRAKS